MSEFPEVIPEVIKVEAEPFVKLAPLKTRAHLNMKARAFLQNLERGMWTDPIGAAREAGYRYPEESARKLVRKYAKYIERDKDRLWTRLIMTSVEVQAVLSDIARGTLQPTSPYQVKALETMARIHGLLSEKLSISLDRRVIEDNLKEISERLAKQGALLPGK